MATIVCYGDSNTWGAIPMKSRADLGRFPLAERWPSVMGATLGGGHTVIAEGLNGRTTSFDSPFRAMRSGAAMLPALLETHAPVDVVVIMLGSNDLQTALGLSANYAASGVASLLDIVARSLAGPNRSSPQALVVAPPHIMAPSGFMGVLWEGREAESQRLANCYAPVAAISGAAFFDSAAVVSPSVADGVHLDADGQRILGARLAVEVAPLLPGNEG